jgi:ankyrin repeat protein
VDSLSSGGLTALHTAARNARHEAVRVLCEAGADVQLQATCGAAAIHFACLSGSVRTVRCGIVRDHCAPHVVACA